VELAIMTHLATGFAARQLESLFEGGSAAGFSDRQLLERFNARRDAAGEAAFGALVARHGSMVLGVCRQLLGDHQHAEDAFQAVFFVLARKARSIRDPDRLGNWLYGVALRTARCARNGLARRRRHEEAATMTRSASAAPVEPMAPPADEAVMAREQAEALHGEIELLPDAFRTVVVMCYLEGLSVHEAASRLKWSHGTVRSRMARARDKLRRGLVRRGVALPAAALAAVLDARSASASVSSPLCDSTTRAAIHFAAGPAAGETIAASTSALAQEVLRSMLIHKLKLVMLALLVLGAVASGAGLLTRAPAMKDEPTKAPVATTRPAAARPDGAAQGRMTIVGRVLDPAGQPVAGAPVEVVGLPRRPLLDRDDAPYRLVLMGRGKTGTNGRFRLDAPRTSSVSYFSVHAMAAAPGCGLGWVELNAAAPEPAAEIRLKPEQVVRGRLVDVNGQPAAGVELRVTYISRPQIEGELPDSLNANDGPPEGCRLWPGPVKTDAQGRFAVPGIGRGLRTLLEVADPRFAPQQLDLLADDRDGAKEATLALQAARVVEGRVLDADTGRPVPGAMVSMSTNRLTRSRADEQGRFRTQPPPPDRYNSNDTFGINVFPPEGSPYLIPRISVTWTKGELKRQLDIKLKRGVVIRGKVTEQWTGRPLGGGCTIEYEYTNGPEDVQMCREASVASHDDGTFEMVVPPGRGYLLVYGPTPDYVLEEIGQWMLHQGRPGGDRYYAHRIIPYEAKVGDKPHEVVAALRPARTIKGRVLGPDGQPVARAFFITRLYIEPFNVLWRGGQGFQLQVRDGRFELHGVDPEKSAPVYFLDADHEWGATLEASGKLAGEDVTVRLQPCGRAVARLVGPDGRPVTKEYPWLEIVATPAGTEFSRDRKDRGQLFPDVAFLDAVDPKHYRYKRRPLSDAEGHVTLPALVPGAPYRLLDRSDPKVPVRKAFTVQPGETLDLGDVLVNKPSS
jgi:RNA polymerase sigma factor (sigma-70 family)